jgi:hypothetical protein
MEPGTLKIVKAKNFSHKNPNGYFRKWKLVKGCIFIPQTDWLPPEGGEF